ncbi:choice-of-anchor D domain-containing protein [Flavobacterium sp. IMCC34852]|uniref:Choice-of-anchor D domain-containing protein n=1 Tax=Flavobacterium rivulicola TaxID=2732161 RepID=A0A7Y3R6K6_9FLAO|nr:choice-of-anchor D domain-containing protein [Flavobacterium sp. IMCC34852]NNT70859.1 choice-of-anchor D domain-containing protein [Flavobacterium sp. IMCC34852]
MKFKLLLVTFFALVLNSVSSYGQVTIFSENMGTPSANTAIATYVGGTAPATFQNVSTLTYTGVGTTDVRTSTPSTGYAGASGNGNVFITSTIGNSFQISGINTSGYTSLSLSFGQHKSTTGSTGSDLLVEVSSDGTTYTALTYTRATGTGTAVWALVTPTGTIPSTTNLRIRFRQTATATQYRIDDVVLTGTVAGIVSIASGNWSDPATWTGGNVPDPSENAIIQNGHVVTMDSATYNIRNANTTVDAGGTLATNLTFTNNGIATINGTFQINAGGYADGTNLSYGTNGTLNFNTGWTYNVANTHTYWPAAVGAPKNVNIASGTTVVMAINAYRAISTGGVLSIAGALTLTTNPTITVNGTLRLDAGGYLNAGAMPIYGNASTLLYNTGGTYGRGLEWNAAGVGTIGTTPGYPNHVQISNNTTINYINGAASGAVGSKAIAGNLTIDAGSALHMDYGSVSAGGELVVAGNITNAGTLTLGFAVGDDLRVTGNLTNTGTFNGSNRAVYFNRTGTQIVTSAAGITIPYLRTAGSGTTVQFTAGTNVVVSAALTGNAVVFGSASDVIDLNGNTLTIGTASVANVIVGTGTFKGSTTSNLTLLGTGSIGTVYFTTGFQNLGTFTVNRTSGAVACVLGSPLAVNTSLALTNGIVDLGNNPMTIGASGTITGASSSNFIIADVANGASVALRKTLSAAGTFTFPIGDSAASADGMQYSPVTVVFSGGTYGGYAGFAVNDIKEPNLDASTHYITRYWKVTTSGIAPTTYAVTGTYLPVDVVGTEATCQSNQWNGASWTNGGAPVTTNTMSITCNTFPATNHLTAGARDREINVVQVATNYLNGSTYDFGTVLTSATLDVVFTIQNLGQQTITLTNPAPTISGNPPYSVFANYSGATVPIISGTTPGTRTFTIRFAPTAAGTFTGSATIINNDSNENPYVINFTGVGQLPQPDINLQGLGNNIAPGNTPVGTDNTLFAAQAIGSTSAANTFTIQNLGTAGLNLSGLSPYVTLGGANPSDFAIVAVPSNSVGVGSSTTFTITFTPTFSGTRTATVTIASNDPDEPSYTFNISGTGTCTAFATISTVTPASGPVGTNVTITASSGDLTGTTVAFNSIPATIISSSATQLVVTVPAGAITGNINITKTATGCILSSAYTVTNITGVCAGLTNLIMTEIYDQDGGSLGYIEVYNGTGATIDLTSYFIRRYADNAALIANSYTDYAFAPSITSIANGEVKYGRISNDANTASPDFDYSTPGFAGINGDDIFHLYQGTTLVDVYIVPNNTIGYTAKRNTNTAGPNTSSTPSDWTHTTTETLADLGTFVYTGPLSTVPTVTTDPVDVTTCNTTATFTAGATAGPGAGTLSYQWYYNSGTASGWTAVAASSLTGVAATNFNTNTLTLTGAIGAFSGYQFYCQVTQNTTCNVASDAAQLMVDATVWSGTAWSNGAPDLTTGVVIAGNYDTATDGSFEACSVTINPAVTLDINPNDHVAIQNNLYVNATGTLLVQNNGSLVMIDDAGVVTNNGTTNVIRTTAPFELYDYTYWSSPVNGANITSTFIGWRTDYSFEFNAANYSDLNTIDYYGTVTAAGVPDSFDDFAPWAWLPYTGNMTNGKGYAIMGPTGLAFAPSATTTVTFSGPVNNGVIQIPIVESGNAANTADDFNLIGNPYASAIFADDFITTNGTKTSGSLYFWTHVDDVSVSNPGPSLYNFITDDYAVYNLSGGTRASFTGSAVPTGYIASAQGFFVEAQGNNTLTFNNAMRDKDYDNDQFFRTAQPQAAEKDRLWLNLRNGDGMFGQLLVAYLPQSTLDFDWAYDARVNQSNNYLSFYTLGNNEKYKIQARSNFVESDIVPIGYFSSVDGEFSISIDQQEGVFNSEATNIYIEDLALNIIHDLKAAPYTFTTVNGKFDNRFLLRYTNGSALDNPDFDTLNNSVVVAANQGELMIKSYLQTINEVIVYDVLGRQLYQAKGIGANDFVANNITLSQQSLIVKIKLESGTVITKKILMN